MLQTRTVDQWLDQLNACRAGLNGVNTFSVSGRLRRSVGMTLEAEGIHVPIGVRCRILNPGLDIEAEVVGFDNDRTFLIPLADSQGIRPGARVVPVLTEARTAVGERLLGRVIDGLGRPLDGRGELRAEEWVTPSESADNPLERAPVNRPIDVGVRSINTFTTIGQGQRIGLFAGSGVGKSILLGMVTRFTSADVVVVGLIGERGREVQEFIHNILGPQAQARSVIVASPADTSPVHRIHAAERATTIARHFRDQGKNVLLLMDSLTRYAQAHREIALAVGEPPATKGYTASVFARLSELVERAGNGPGEGSLTAVYTVLVDGDDHNDPVADSARSFLDGHIVLSRTLAEAGVYPALDVERSISRVMPAVTSDEHRRLTARFLRLYATYEQNKDLITVGAYSAGSDPLVDEAIARRPEMLEFLRQEMEANVSFDDGLAALSALFPEAEG
ncbi:MAG: FliI/YscN family ATPase [Pseudomonadota bacterium]